MLLKCSALLPFGRKQLKNTSNYKKYTCVSNKAISLDDIMFKIMIHLLNTSGGRGKKKKKLKMSERIFSF